MKPCGIQTEVVDRYIVTQNRQAVSVEDPVMLVKYLESLMGAADYEALLQGNDQELSSISAAIDSLHDEIDRCVPAGPNIIAVSTAS